jgi:hypothetical protein
MLSFPTGGSRIGGSFRRRLRIRWALLAIGTTMLSALTEVAKFSAVLLRHSGLDPPGQHIQGFRRQTDYEPSMLGN